MPAVSRRAALVLIVLAFCGALLVGRFRAGGSPPAGQAPASTGSTSSSAAAPLLPAAGPLLVHVVGAVRRPGVYELAAGARARDAVTAAGGATRRAVLEGLNLAAPVADGEQVAVPVEGEVSRVAATPAKPAIVSLSRADAAALDTLPGVGPATAQRIIAYRDDHGPFAQVDDLLDVPGIGESKLAAMRELVAP